eukprot:364241-Chlamydomonas_euryale.AAC.3
MADAGGELPALCRKDARDPPIRGLTALFQMQNVRYNACAVIKKRMAELAHPRRRQQLDGRRLGGRYTPVMRTCAWVGGGFRQHDVQEDSDSMMCRRIQTAWTWPGEDSDRQVRIQTAWTWPRLPETRTPAAAAASAPPPSPRYPDVGLTRCIAEVWKPTHSCKPSLAFYVVLWEDGKT